MKTFNIIQAAEFLGAHKETIRRLAANKEIPGVKIGRSWIFLEQDLVMHIRNNYSGNNNSQSAHNRNNEKWHLKEKMAFGGLTSPTLENAYEKALKLK